LSQLSPSCFGTVVSLPAYIIPQFTIQHIALRLWLVHKKPFQAPCKTGSWVFYMKALATSAKVAAKPAAKSVKAAIMFLAEPAVKESIPC